MTTDAQANYIVAFVRNEQYDSMSEQDMLDSVQIELGSSATSYAPYSNICPISGFTGVNVPVKGKNLFNLADFATTYQ